MLREEVIEPPISEWASLVVFAPKKDGSLIFSVNYRNVNTVTRIDSYFLSKMDKSIDSLTEARMLSRKDASFEYWQIETDACDRYKTVLTCHYRLLQFLQMSFDLENALMMFQRATSVILLSEKWHSALLYLNDIMIYSKTPATA